MAYQTFLTGYPPPDSAVLDFLTTTTSFQNLSATSIVRHFFIALFRRTQEALGQMNSNSKSERIRLFRDSMSEGQRMTSIGAYRQAFYRGVIDKAQEVRRRIFVPFVVNMLILKGLRNSFVQPDILIVQKALMELHLTLNGSDSSTKHRIAAKGNSDSFVDIFIAFDEAHMLSKFTDSGERRFVVLRRELNRLRTSPLFVLFLSTTGQITQFDQPRDKDSSSRIFDGTFATPKPYIYLGFDQLMQRRKVFSTWRTLDDVTSLDCVAHMGRPL